MAACKCRLCSGRKRYAVPHPFTAFGGSLTLAPNPLRVAIRISGQADVAAALITPALVVVLHGASTSTSELCRQSLWSPLELFVEDYGTLIMEELTVVSVAVGQGFSVIEILQNEGPEFSLAHPLE